MPTAADQSPNVDVSPERKFLGFDAYRKRPARLYPPQLPLHATKARRMPSPDRVSPDVLSWRGGGFPP